MKVNIKSPEFIFIIFAFVFGIIMLFLTPKFQVPDEPAHFDRALEVSRGILYNNPEHPAQGYQFHGASGYSPLLYAVSAAGTKVGSLAGENAAFYAGRLANLFIWILMIAFAINITPVFKWMFVFSALLPMSIFEGMSYAADSFNNAFAFLFFAYIFKFIFEKKELHTKELLILVCMSVLSAFTKGGIYPIFLYVFLPMKKHKYLFSIFCLILAFLLMTYWSSINYTFINPAADAAYNKYLLLHQPSDFLLKYARAIFYNLSYYIKGCIGILGWLSYYFHNIVYLFTGLVFLSLFYVFPEQKVKDSIRLWAIFLICLYTTILHILIYITWTPVDFMKVTGVQGRYFISVLPFFFLMFAQSRQYFSEKFVKNYKIFLLVYLFFFLLYACVRLVKAYYPAVFYFYMFK